MPVHNRETRIWRIAFGLWLLFAFGSLASCNLTGTPDNSSPTATAQARYLLQLATRQAFNQRRTQAAEAIKATSTAEAFASVLSTQKSWPIVFVDDFQDNANDWPVGDEANDLTNVTFKVNNVYRWEAEAVDSFIYWARPETPIVTDFYLSVDARQISGAEDGQVGLLFRQVDSENYYLFRISNDRYFSVHRSTAEGWETIIDWTTSESILPNQSNHLVVTAQDNRFRFLINGIFVGDAYDDALQSGMVGVAIGLFEAGDLGVFDFDNFELRAPASAIVEP